MLEICVIKERFLIFCFIIDGEFYIIIFNIDKFFLNFIELVLYLNVEKEMVCNFMCFFVKLCVLNKGILLFGLI